MSSVFPSRAARAAAWLLLPAACLVAGCAPRQLVLQGVANALADAGGTDEEDLLLARDAAPVMLKASEAVLRQTPGHVALATTVAAGFTQYAYAFVAFEADKTEANDARAARVLRDRAARLYRRAQRHAMAALEQRHPGLRRTLAGDAAAPAVVLADDEIGLAYWAAAAWGGWISLAKDEPDVVADLPQAVALARLAYERSPDHARGALAVLMGNFEAARPGGSAAGAQRFFERAAAAAAEPDPAVLVAMAESLARPAGDRVRYEALLQQALAAGNARQDLATQVMRERARWLLATADDVF